MPPARVDVFRIPTRILFGRGVALTVADPLRQIGAKRVLLVTDKGVRAAGLVKPIEAALQDAKIPYEIYDDVVPDPGVGEVQRAYERARAYGADALVAVGGGSAIDTAKMAATLLTNGGTVLDYVGLDRVPRPAAPVVAIPTTAGTGAEITINSVIADPEQHKKLVIISPNATALFALEDPDMTVTLPAFGTAITGMDTLVHAIESFVNKIAQVSPQMVTYNGCAFDLPVLRYRAMIHQVFAPGMHNRAYYHRYTDDNVDLCDLLSSFSYGAKVKLDELSRIMGLPGKPDGIDGSQVEA